MNAAKFGDQQGVMIEKRRARMPSGSGNSSTAPFAQRGGRTADDDAVPPAGSVPGLAGQAGRCEQQVPEYQLALALLNARAASGRRR